jgi:hypothetical protein
MPLEQSGYSFAIPSPLYSENAENVSKKRHGNQGRNRENPVILERSEGPMHFGRAANAADL